MSNKKDTSLLREYVRDCLREDSYSGYADAGVTAADIAGASPYGMSFGSGSELAKTFIEPFTDVFKTAVGKTKEITRTAATAIPVAVGVILSTLIPGVSAHYKEVFDAEKKDLDKIKSQYKDVYARTNEALASSDAAFLAFMASPSAVMGAWGLSKAPGVMSGILSVASGGLSDQLFEKIKNENFGSSSGPEKKKKSITRDAAEEKKKSSDGKKKQTESFVKEAEEPEEESRDDKIARKIYSNEKFINAVANSPKMREMQKVATETYRASLKEVYDQVDALFNKVKTVEDLKKFSKKPIPEIEKVEKLQGEEKQKAEQMLLEGTRKAIKQFYIKSLTTQYESVIRAGIPEDSQYVKDYKATIQKIKAL